MLKNFYITTPIYYPSQSLHIGHCYCTIIADVIARYKRMQEYNVLFVTGTDEHGQKIQNNSAKLNITPKVFVDKIVNDIYILWKKLDISYNYFIRTTDSYHIDTVQKTFKQLMASGDIYKGKYVGKYCVPCETFVSAKEKNNLCPECNRELIKFAEDAYFFKLSKYKNQILNWYNSNKEILYPNMRLKEMVNFINFGLDDLCITRKNLSWGINVPDDNDYVIYVWFEALLNYVSILGYNNKKFNKFKDFWPCDLHIIGKEITRFHLVIWPAILIALNIELPKKIISHSWILMNGKKMSKSIGNIIDPIILCDKYGSDAFRYFLLREFDFSNDSQYSEEILINRINTDLSNTFGNLISRTFSMINKYFNGNLSGNYLLNNDDESYILNTKINIKNYLKHMENFQLKEALIVVMNLLKESNKYIDINKPWIKFKNNEISNLYTNLYNITENIRLACVMLHPFMPHSTDLILKQLNCNINNININKLLKFGILNKHIEIIINDNTILFPRII